MDELEDFDPDDLPSEEPEHFEISEDLQRNILNLIIVDRSFLINSLSLIRSDYFGDMAHQNICKITQEYFEKYNKLITQDVLAQELKNKLSKSKQLPRILSELDIILEKSEQAYQEKDYLEQGVIRFAKAQALKTAILKSVDLIELEKYDEIEENIRQALLVAPNVSLGSDLFEDVSERYMRLMAEQEGEKFTAGWPTIDRCLMGGLGRKEVGMIFANAGVGKSLYLSKIAIENMIRGKNVLYVSCEMSEDRVLVRTDSMLSQIPIGDLLGSVEELKRRYEKIKGHIEGKLKVKEFPAGASTIKEFRSYANQLYNYTGFKPDLILLDYIDEVKCSNSRLDTYAAQGHTLREFRAWMQSDNLCGYTATQANRIGRQVKTITETEMGDSFLKIRIVDACWSISQDDTEKAKNVARLFAVKHRNAASRFIVWIRIDPLTLRMTEITEAEYEQMLGTAPPAEVVGEEAL
jgi:replicative DNA helicase